MPSDEALCKYKTKRVRKKVSSEVKHSASKRKKENDFRETERLGDRLFYCSILAAALLRRKAFMNSSISPSMTACTSAVS
mmetsp:Transcript_4006/g.5678  ORF Transcript_4006/g.5678 Transcript_4006/m.5678 type:complete len:80 (+) Transcript_4006:919-1158(+)